MEPRGKVPARLVLMSAGALFVWGMLLGVAPLVAGELTWQRSHGVWTTATAAAFAAIAVVALFVWSAGRAR